MFGWPVPKGAPKDAKPKAFEYPGGTKEMKLEYIDRVSYRNAKRPDKVSFQVRVLWNLMAASQLVLGTTCGGCCPQLFAPTTLPAPTVQGRKPP